LCELSNVILEAAVGDLPITDARFILSPHVSNNIAPQAAPNLLDFGKTGGENSHLWFLNPPPGTQSQPHETHSPATSCARRALIPPFRLRPPPRREARTSRLVENSLRKARAAVSDTTGLATAVVERVVNRACLNLANRPWRLAGVRYASPK
ncbi:unnamed protein product, partial [Ectocarpus sp. 13 AM-2016]